MTKRPISRMEEAKRSLLDPEMAWGEISAGERVYVRRVFDETQSVSAKRVAKIRRSRPRKYYAAVDLSPRALRSPDITQGLVCQRGPVCAYTRRVHRHHASSPTERNTLLPRIS